jgi:ubiquinone/menaquinone biosynthesis C-methylase UbiE
MTLTLDVGCGPRKKEGFLGVDIEQFSQVDFLMSATDLKFDDCTVDEIYSRRCLSHIPDDAKALSEFYRVLKPNGKVTILVFGWLAVIWVRTIFELQWKWSKKSFWAKRYGVCHFYIGNKLSLMLKSAGFSGLTLSKVKSKHPFAYDIKVEGYKRVASKQTLTLDVGCGGSGDFAYQQTTQKPHESQSMEYESNVDKGFVFSPTHADIAIDVRKPKFKRENFVLASGEALPFKTKAFSTAYCTDVLEHINGPVYLIAEMKRVANKILVVTPNSLSLPNILMSAVRKSQRYEPYPDHVAVWSKAEMENLLRRVGFRKYAVTWTNERRHRPHWYVRLLLALCPFPALKYGALVVTAE